MVTGRPSKLDDKKFVDDFISCIECGLPIKYACDHTMISERVFYNWKKVADQEDEHALDDDFVPSKIYEFIQLVKKAHVNYIMQANHTIRSGINGWQGSAWWLERTDHTFMPNQGEKQVSEPINVTTGMPAKHKDKK